MDNFIKAVFAFLVLAVAVALMVLAVGWVLKKEEKPAQPTHYYSTCPYCQRQFEIPRPQRETMPGPYYPRPGNLGDRNLGDTGAKGALESEKGAKK